MTEQPAPPPPPIGPEAAAARARVEAENAAFQAQIQNQALREAAGAFDRGRGEARTGNISVVRDADGRVVVTGADGRVMTIDPKVGLDEDAIQHMVQTALEPPRPQREPGRRADPTAVVAIVFSFLFLMVLVITVGSVFRRRAGVRAVVAAVPPELTDRLARIEQAVEAVAIEVERISESERYSARLLTERLPERPPERLPERPAAAPGQAAPLPTLDVSR